MVTGLFSACCHSRVCFSVAQPRRSGHVITLPSIVNKQAGSLLTCSTQRIPSTLVQWCSPGSRTAIGLKSNAFHYKMRNKDWINHLKAKPSTQWSLYHRECSRRARQGGGRAQSTVTSRGYTNNIVALVYLESATSVHSTRSCYPRQRGNVFTPLKKQAIYYHLLILSMVPCEQSRDPVFSLNTRL